MARPKKSRGFTLVELLVVITIIGMLVSLLLPAIQAAREAGRRTTCLNNMRQAAIGLTTVEQTKKAFPGYVFPIVKGTGAATATYRASWVVQIMPAIEQSQLYQNWTNPAVLFNWTGVPTTDNRAQFITQLGILQCASNASPDLPDDALSYVVNTGIAMSASDNYAASNGALMVPTWPEDSASGVCFNQSQLDYASGKAPGGKRVNMDYISTHDGSTNTLLVTENLQSGGWATDPTNSNSPFQTDFAARASVGAVWFITGAKNNELPVSMTMEGFYNSSAIGINDQSQVVSGRPQGNYSSMNVTQPTGLAYARPSANHSGGLNSMFCGGNGRFLSEEMDYKVYTQLMTPYEAHVIVDYEMGDVPIKANTAKGTILAPVSTTGTTKVPVPWGYILDEANL